ncbi:EF-hand [Athelia psychrophila]|uniref:EF-hand n=1 Tax=Athelia psychrophila TaxID=1759441 RepID=A0A166SP63_9AGAM|nr:EF-hand [Fibularhizoctonia sp. CBS 109695]
MERTAPPGYGSSPAPGGYGAGPAPGGYGASAGPGGFAPPGRSGPPPGADPQLWAMFSAVDRDLSGAISATELQEALINGDWSPFDLDTVKLLMTMFDTDRSGTIGFNEFSGLWQYILDWQNVFKHFDRDQSGSIEGSELAQALQQFGYNLSPKLLGLVQRKYGGRNAAPPGITFDRFVRACVVIKQLSECFRKLDTDNDGWVQINYDQFMETVLQLP